MFRALALLVACSLCVAAPAAAQGGAWDSLFAAHPVQPRRGPLALPEAGCSIALPTPDSIAIIASAAPAVQLRVSASDWVDVAPARRPDTLVARVVKLECVAHDDTPTHVVAIGRGRMLRAPVKGVASYVGGKLAGSLTGEVRKRTAAERAAARAALTNKGWSRSVAEKVLDGIVAIGMTAPQVRASWGTPERINSTITATGRLEQWVYGDDYVYLRSGRVIAIQTSR